MDAPALLQFSLPICPPTPVPIPHVSYTPAHSHTPHPLIPPGSPTLPSPAPSSRVPPSLHLSATLSQHPSFLLPPPSPFLSPSSTRPHLSLSLPHSHHIPPPLLFPIHV